MKIKKKNTTIPINGKIVDTENVEDKTSNAPSMRLVEEMTKDIYSTAEQTIGTWIDGKPLYRKVIDTLTLPSNATVEYDITNLNIATITKLYGTASYNNGQLAKPLPFVSSGTSQIRLDVNDKKIRLITYESWSPYPSAIVIEYTKTTD